MDFLAQILQRVRDLRADDELQSGAVEQLERLPQMFRAFDENRLGFVTRQFQPLSAIIPPLPKRFLAVHKD